MNYSKVTLIALKVLCSPTTGGALRNVHLESLYKESSAMRGLKFWKQHRIQILSIEKTQVLTMHEYNNCITVEFLGNKMAFKS